jgi:hypothetical protein
MTGVELVDDEGVEIFVHKPHSSHTNSAWESEQ